MALRDFLGHYGISTVDFPSVAGSYTGNVVVCGDAACIWGDLEKFGCRVANGVAKDGWDFFTVNRAVETFPGKVEHCYSNNGYLLAKFIAVRRQEYAHEFGPPNRSHAATMGAEYTWPWSCHGTSGLGAILTAIGLGYRKIVLCGMPLDEGRHNGEPPWRRCRFTTEVPDDDPHWGRAMHLAFEGKVTSMSGRTRQWLGLPA